MVVSNISLCSPLPGEMIQFDKQISQIGWFNHQLVVISMISYHRFHFGYVKKKSPNNGSGPPKIHGSIPYGQPDRTPAARWALTLPLPRPNAWYIYSSRLLRRPRLRIKMLGKWLMFFWLVVSNMFYCHPDPWGNDPTWLIKMFSNGLKPPTSFFL